MIVSRKENLGTLKYRYVIFSHLVLLLKAVMGSSELCTNAIQHQWLLFVLENGVV